MPLEFPAAWRFARRGTTPVPDAVVSEFIDLIARVAVQGERQRILEQFKGYFCRAAGVSHVWSTSESWAETDLRGYMEDVAKNAPIFIEAMHDACSALRATGKYQVPDVAVLNEVLRESDVPYEIRPPELVRVGAEPVMPKPATERRPVAQDDDEEEAELPARFDVALSFAGSDRQLAEELATILRDHGVNVFYDGFYKHYLWGKNLVDVLDEVYRHRARFCVMFVSEEYAKRIWTTHERRSAQAKAVLARDTEYVLPVRVDDTDLPGLPTSVAYLALDDHSIEDVAAVLLKKLKRKYRGA